MLEEILLSQHECVHGCYSLPNIDWTLQRPTPEPGNKLMQLDNLTQHVRKTTRHDNIYWTYSHIYGIRSNCKPENEKIKLETIKQFHFQ